MHEASSLVHIARWAGLGRPGARPGNRHRVSAQPFSTAPVLSTTVRATGTEPVMLCVTVQ